VVAGAVHLHGAGKDRIGGRQHRPEEEGGRRVQAEQQHGAQSHTYDGCEHDWSAQPAGGDPGRVLEGKPQLQPTDEQRDDHRHFGQPLEPADLVAQIDPEPAEPERSDRQAQGQVDGRGRDRQVPQVGGGQRHQQQQPAGQGHPAEEIHGVA
jgi:hypothetical protein